jgi:hypothetical protein
MERGDAVSDMELAAGDEVAMVLGRARGGYSVQIGVVDKLTATHIVLTNGTRFRRSDRLMVGVTRSASPELVPVTDERVVVTLAAHRVAQLLSTLERRAYRLSTLSLGNIRAFVEGARQHLEVELKNLEDDMKRVTKARR